MHVFLERRRAPEVISSLELVKALSGARCEPMHQRGCQSDCKITRGMNCHDFMCSTSVSLPSFRASSSMLSMPRSLRAFHKHVLYCLKSGSHSSVWAFPFRNSGRPLVTGQKPCLMIDGKKSPKDADFEVT